MMSGELASRACAGFGAWYENTALPEASRSVHWPALTLRAEMMFCVAASAAGVLLPPLMPTNTPPVTVKAPRLAFSALSVALAPMATM